MAKFISYRVNQTLTLDTYPSVEVGHEVMRTCGNSNVSINTCLHFGDWSKLSSEFEEVNVIYSIAMTEAIANHVCDKERESTPEIDEAEYLFALIHRVDMHTDDANNVHSYLVSFALLNTPNGSILAKMAAEENGDDPSSYYAVLIERKPNKTVIDILTDKVKYIVTMSKLEKDRVSLMPIPQGQQFVCTVSIISAEEFERMNNESADEEEAGANEEAETE